MTILINLMCILLLLSCNNEKIDIFRTGTLSIPTNLDPTKNNEVHKGVILNHICAKMFNVTQNLINAPDIVSNWSLSEDLKSYTFNLKEKKFNNGDSVTSEDVIFTLKNAASNNSATLKALSGIKGFKRDCLKNDCTPKGLRWINDKSFIIELDTPDNRFIHKLSSESLCILNRETPFYKVNNINVPNSSGEFEIKMINSKSLVLNRRNKSDEYINNIELLKVDHGKEIDAFNNQTIDDLSLYFVSPSNAKKLTRGHSVLNHSFYFNWVVLFNAKSKTLSNLNIRKYIYENFPLKEFQEQWAPNNIKANGLIPFGFGYKFSNEKNKFQNTKSDIKCPKNGLKLFSIKGINNETKYRTLFESWGKKINCQINVLPVSVNDFEKKLSSGVGDIYFYGHSTRYAEPLFFFDIFYSKSSMNSLGFSDTKFDNIYSSLNLDPASEVYKLKIYELERVISKLGWVIPISSPSIKFYSSDKFEGVSIHPLTMAYTNWSKVKIK